MKCPTLTQHPPQTPNRSAEVLGGCWVITQRPEASQGIDCKALPLSRPRLLSVWSRKGLEPERRPVPSDQRVGRRSSPACCRATPDRQAPAAGRRRRGFYLTATCARRILAGWRACGRSVCWAGRNRGFVVARLWRRPVPRRGFGRGARSTNNFGEGGTGELDQAGGEREYPYQLRLRRVWAAGPQSTTRRFHNRGRNP
jgi:hypothetical protein